MKRALAAIAAALTISTMIFGAGTVSVGAVTVLKKTGETEAAEETTEESTQKAEVPEDGTYSVTFDTDSSMFYVNEALDGKGVLTVKDGEMTVHVSLAGKGIINLFAGLAEDAKKDGAELLEPTTDTVTYSDGETKEVYGFDIPVPALNEEFDVALIGKKGIWYDHKVSVSDPVKIELETAQTETESESAS